ncbi:copper resistance protein NlpE [Flavobacterium akiainvivens]|uniref:copper resistance protein NlpE n=1 Tax=Flavobacterium akiainvivens TaxID=1202724 RepID=UPI0008E9B461|nr:copper resistance protein NlpE [Flavobacterium akiainvivens]SFQ69550.1 Uncharacterized lipoprotein NlpE involved in copper resistance [Flavobacterium akiainvivens]
MKTLKITLLAALLTLSIGCKNDAEKTSVEQQEQGTLPSVEHDTTTPADTTGGASVTPENDTPAWVGNYSGSLPCGDCKGILTKITLNGNKTYTLSSQYIGKETKPTVYNGTFNLDDKNIATLDAEGDHLKFQLMPEDDMVVKLDKFGNAEQGGPAARYFLHRVK